MYYNRSNSFYHSKKGPAKRSTINCVIFDFLDLEKFVSLFLGIPDEEGYHLRYQQIENYKVNGF